MNDYDKTAERWQQLTAEGVGRLRKRMQYIENDNRILSHKVFMNELQMDSRVHNNWCWLSVAAMFSGSVFGYHIGERFNDLFGLQHLDVWGQLLGVTFWVSMMVSESRRQRRVAAAEKETAELAEKYREACYEVDD